MNPGRDGACRRVRKVSNFEFDQTLHTMNARSTMALFAIVVCWTMTAFGQLTVQWTIGGNGTMSSIKETATGGFIATGMVGEDVLFMTVDASGANVLQYAYGGSGLDSGSDVIQTVDGGYILVGTTFSNDGDVTGNHGGGDIWVVKLNEVGVIQWQRTLGGGSVDEGTSVLQTADGEFLVLGTVGSSDGDVIGNHGDQDIWVARLDASGDLNWSICLGGSGQDHGSDWLLLNDSASVIVAGATRSNDGDVTGNHGNQDFWVAKVEASGTVIWQKCFGGSNSDVAASIEATMDGGYLLAGWSFSNDGDVTPSSFNAGYSDMWMVRLDLMGDVQWQKSLGSLMNDRALVARRTYNDGYLVLADVDQTGGDITVSPWGYWIGFLNASGDLQWQAQWGGPNDSPMAMEVTADSGLVAIGNKFQGSWTWTAVKFGAINMATPEAERKRFSASPNPTSGAIRLVFTTPTAKEIRVIDPTGRSIMGTAISGSSSAQIDLSDYADGLYSVQVTFSTGERAAERLVKE